MAAGRARSAPIGDPVEMSSANTPLPREIVRLVGVYDADSTVRGELSYWIGARLGRRHCGLCDITHGSVRRRPEWKARATSLRAPFDTYHRNDQPDDVRAATGGRAPAVVAETRSGHVVLLGPDEIDACGGSIESLVDAIGRAVDSHRVVWPGGDDSMWDVPG
jgi:hypothetical protein